MQLLVFCLELFCDLPYLRQRFPGGDWAARLAPRSHWVRERYTLIDDPAFYARARGGFGLAWGRPFIYPGYVGSYWRTPRGGGSAG